MTKKLSLALMMGTLLVASNVLALGIGEIKVDSSLNQRLNAELELHSSLEGELDDVNVKLGDARAFARIKLPRPHLLTGIMFQVTTRKDGTPIVKLTTKESIREPFLNFLVEVSWPKGKLLREYTILLDPPVSIAASPKSAAPVTSKSKPAAAPVTKAAPEAPAVEAAVVETVTHDTGRTDSLGFPIYSDSPAGGGSSAASQPSYSGDSYGPVAAQETLWSIANKTRSGSVSNQQMMLALFEANPDAFIDGDIHHIKRGAVLRIPDAATIESREQSTALAEVRQLNANLSTPPADRSSAMPEQPGVIDTPATKTPAVTAPAAEETKLSLLTPDNAASSKAGTSSQKLNNLQRELSLAEETMTSQRMENQELKSRVSELEGTIKQMEELKRLLEIQNQEMSQLQQQMASNEATAAQQPAPVAETPPAAEMAPEVAIEPAPEVASEPATPEVAVEPAPVEETAPAESAEVEAVEVGAGTEVETYAAEEPVAVDEPTPLPPPVKKGPLDVVMDYVNKAKNDPMLAGIAAGILLILIVLVVVIIKRKKGAEEYSHIAPTVEAPVEAEVSDGVTVEKAPMFAVLKDKLSGMFSKKEAEEEDIDLSDMFPDEDDAAETDLNATATHDVVDSGTEDATVFEAPADPAVADMDFETDEDTPAAPSAPAGPDPLEEVDVYEAFGDFDQAAEIVKQALANDPDNNDFKLRLFGVYNSGGMADEFATAAVQHQAAMEGSSQWDEIVTMGKTIAPDCAAWSSGGAPAPSPAMPAADAGDMANTMAIDPSSIPSEDSVGAVVSAATGSVDEVGDMTMDFEDLDTSGLQSSMDDDAIADMTPVAAMPAIEDEPAEANMADSMEFDLGELNFESADSDASDEPAKDDGSLEFDLDATAVLPEDAVPDMVEDPETIPVPEPVADDHSMEFELDDSISSQSEQVSETVKVDSPGLDFEEVLEAPAVEEIEDATIFLGSKGTVGAADDNELAIDESALSFDTGELAMDMDSMVPPETDSGELVLEEAALSEDPTVMLTDDSDLSIDSLSSDGDEVATKLDLARAYIDMGDADGAKGILTEVESEGSDVQKSEAAELLKQLG